MQLSGQSPHVHWLSMVKTQVSDTGMVRTALVIKNRKLNPNQSEQKRSVLGHITHSQEQGPLQDNLVWASKESACQPRVSAPLGLPYDGSSSFNSMFLQHPVQWRTRECPFGSDGVICLSLCQIPWPRGVLSTGFIARRRVEGGRRRTGWLGRRAAQRGHLRPLRTQRPSRLRSFLPSPRVYGTSAAVCLAGRRDTQPHSAREIPVWLGREDKGVSLK